MIRHFDLITVINNWKKQLFEDSTETSATLSNRVKCIIQRLRQTTLVTTLSTLSRARVTNCAALSSLHHFTVRLRVHLPLNGSWGNIKSTVRWIFLISWDSISSEITAKYLKLCDAKSSQKNDLTLKVPTLHSSRYNILTKLALLTALWPQNYKLNV